MTKRVIILALLILFAGLLLFIFFSSWQYTSTQRKEVWNPNFPVYHTIVLFHDYRAYGLFNKYKLYGPSLIQYCFEQKRIQGQFGISINDNFCQFLK